MSALGSALFAVVSAYSFTEFVEPRAETNYQIDVTRIASNVVTGVGFLGGGAILKLGASVRGLTTAASLWVTAAVGLAVGLGNYRIGALSAGALILALTLLRGRRRWLRRFTLTKETVIIQVAPGADAGQLIASLQGLPHVDVRSLSAHRGGGRWTIQADVNGADLPSVLADLTGRQGVLDVEIVG
jgi:putative Mg2+ transporter-C (MgtC) family protein